MRKALFSGGGLLIGLLVFFLSLPFLVIIILIGPPKPAPSIGGAGGGLSGAVPPEYAPWVIKAGSICPEVSPALIAAQIEAESNWNPNAQSPVGALGIAQFMPFNFHLIKDENGNGTASPTEPADEIVAQGRMMCDLVHYFKNQATGEELTKLILAAYNAGPGNVLPKGCATANGTTCRATIPPFTETQNYVARILAAIPKYQGASVIGGGGAWVDPVAQYTTGGEFHDVGSHWRMCGWHTGYDYSAPTGTDVHAASAGTVIHADWGSSPGGTGGAYGNQIIIEHPNRMRSYYAHLSAYAVKAGDQVTTGQLIGKVGSTGNSTGPHLHMELTKTAAFTCDNFINPHTFIASHADDAGDTGTSSTDRVIAAARSQLGIPYSWGGGALDGPSLGMTGVVGFDCSSFVRYAWYQGSGKTVVLPRVSQDQAAQLPKVTDPRPGDLIVWKLSSSDYDHVGLYLGNGQMIHAPNSSRPIMIVDISGGWYANKYHEYRRPA